MPDIQNIHFTMVGYQKDDEPNHALFYMKHEWNSPYPSIWKWTAFGFKVYIHSDFAGFMSTKASYFPCFDAPAKPCRRSVQDFFFFSEKRSSILPGGYWRVPKKTEHMPAGETRLSPWEVTLWMDRLSQLSDLQTMGGSKGHS